jgi:predicted Zn-dependent protease
MKTLFQTLVQHAHTQLQADEVLLSNFSGEVSDFVRFNHGVVRQAMTVRQAYLELRLIKGTVHSSFSMSVGGDPAADREHINEAISRLRDDLAVMPADPYLLFSPDANRSERIDTARHPSAGQVIDDVATAAHGTDLVGIFASGPIMKGFASSLGALHWHEVASFAFDWSLYHRADKAVKRLWSGNTWDRTELQTRIDAAREDLAHLTKPARQLSPGEYRAYLAPAAVEDLVGMLNWEGLSAKAQRSQQSCLQRLVSGQNSLSEQVTLTEDTANGLAPGFDEMGFTRPPEVQLIEAGEHRGSMIAPRTAAEYGIEHNGADADEGAQSLSLAGGTLDANDALQALGTGLAIGNLHYLNFSDAQAARITGMTRFATFWVEDGRIVAPVDVMRWDDSLFRLLGSQLEALTREPQWLLSSSSYEERSIQTMRVPGALVKGMRFTL